METLGQLFGFVVCFSLVVPVILIVKMLLIKTDVDHDGKSDI